MYKVFRVAGGYQVFWCPSAPLHFNDCIPYDGKVYKYKQGAYRRREQLQAQLQPKKAEDVAREQQEVA